MANELTLENAPYEVLIKSQVAQSMATNLHLSETQVAKANQSLLALLNDDKLRDCSQGSKIRFAYATALYNYKHPNAVAPVPYNSNIQAQLQYQAYVEDMLACGHIKEINCLALYKDQKYDGFVNEWGYRELELPEKIKLTDIFEEKEIVGYYAYAKGDDGRVFTSLMSVSQIHEHAKRYSKSYKSENGVWKTNFDKMARKTVIKALARIVLQAYPFDRLAWSLQLDQAVMTENGMEYQDNPTNVGEVEATPSESINNAPLEKPTE